MKQYKILHIYNQCANTTIPLQAFLQLNDKNISKLILSWNQEKDDENIKFFQKNSNIEFDALGFKNKSLWVVLMKYHKYLKVEQPDLIHLHHSYSASLGALIGRFFRKKIVLTIHSDYSKYTLINKILFWLSMLLSNKIIANSQNTFLSIPKLFKKKTVIIYNGVEIDKIIDTKFNLKRTKNQFTICIVARLVKLKDVTTLIKAFKKMNNKYQNIKLYIVGDGPEKKALEKEVIAYNLSHKIDFTGKITRDDVYRILKKSDVFCSTSKWEGFGNAIVEAMASKISVVSSMIPVSKEVIGEENALFFEVGNHDELFLQLEKIYLNKKLQIELANKAFEKAKEFSLKKNTQLHIELYKNLLLKEKK